MKTIKSKFMTEYIIEKIGDYASANKLHDVLGLSLSYLYSIVQNEKVKHRKIYGRKEYEVKSFLEQLELSINQPYLSSPLSKQDFDINNFYNWQARNPIEQFLENLLLDELGEFCSTKELVALFKISKTIWYEALEEGKIMFFNIGNRKIIFTRSLIPFLREASTESL